MKPKLRLLVVLQAMVVALVVAATASASGTAVLFAQTGESVQDVAVDSSGNVFAAVGGGSTKAVAKITPDGVVSTFASGLADYPSFVALGPGGTVFVGNSTGTTRIDKFDASGTALADYSITNGSDAIAIDAAGNLWWIGSSSNKKVGKVPSGTASGAVPTPKTLTESPCGVAVDAAGDVYVGTKDAKVLKFSGSGFSSTSNPVATYTVGTASSLTCGLAVSADHVYFAYRSGMAPNAEAHVDRMPVAGTGTVTADIAWATISPSGMEVTPRTMAIGADGFIYTANQVQGMTGNTGSVSKISTSGSVATLATFAWQPVGGLALDSTTNVFLGAQGMGPGQVAGVYKIAQAAPTPDPTPTPTPDPTPAPGPAVKTNTIPSEIRIASETTPEVKVPCEAADGELLTECTVQITAPRSVLAGLGAGIEVTNARASKTVTLGKATIKPKTPRKRVVVTVKFNQNGKRALRRNVRVSGLIDLTAITQANTQSTGKKRVRLQLPRQTMTPTKGIFDTLSTSLNRDGVIFVNRLAKYLPKKPKQIVCTGYADANGSPGDNRWLGEQRAKTLCAELAKRGIKPTKTRLVSRGADDPRASNKTPAGRAENRRATITITY